MHFVALIGPKSKKLLHQTQTKIKFGTKYQILGFSVSKSYFGSLRNLLSTLLTVGILCFRKLPIWKPFNSGTTVFQNAPCSWFAEQAAF